MEKLNVASIFCGIGGGDLGIKGGFVFLDKNYPKLPVELVYANDNYDEACKIFEANFGFRCDRRDIRNVLSDEIPDHDILIAGFPCQSFSIVAQNPPRLGYKSDNGKLFFEIVRILKAKKPKVFIAENVKGILSANKKRAFPLIIDELSKAGYNVAYKLFNAAEWGVPQKRERVFIVGIRKDLKIKPRFPDQKENIKPTALKEIIFDDSLIDKKYFFSKKAVAGMIKSNPDMNKGRVQNIDEPCATVTSHLAKVSLNSTDPVLKIGKRYRRFTPEEVLRIQAFPDDFRLLGSDFHKYKGIGNAIPPVLMWHVAKEVIGVIEKDCDNLVKVDLSRVPISVSLANR